MSVPRQTTRGTESWILKRSLDTHVLPKWLQEVASLLVEVKDGDVVYVRSKLDKLQLESGAKHVGKQIRIEINPERTAGKSIKTHILGHEIIEE